MFEKEQKELQDQIAKVLKEEDIPVLPIKWNSIPFSGEWGLSTSFFENASAKAKVEKGIDVKKLAAGTAAIVSSRIELPMTFSKVDGVNGYLNFKFVSEYYAQKVIDNILELKDKYGAGKSIDQRVMVEYSQPNTHKAFHVGHLRNMVLGSAICELLDFSGLEVIRTNYLGDIGLHVIKWLWNYIHFHAGEEPPAEGKTRWMGALYAEAAKKIDENPDYEEQVRALFKRWDEKEPEIVTLWKKTRQWSLEAFDEVYALLGIHFDKVYLESEVEESGKDIVQKLIAEDRKSVV